MRTAFDQPAMHYSLAILFFGVWVLSSALTPLCRNAALWLNLVDRPDGTRKLHLRPVPRVGGIAIFLSIAIACASLAFFPASGARAVTAVLVSHWPLLAAMAVVFVTGFVDDLAGLGPRQKLMGLVMAAALACASGIRIHSLGTLDLPLWLSVPATILWLVGCATAFNLIDGLDGLAAGIALLATLGTLAASLVSPGNNYLLGLVLVPMAGALLGFLPYNFNPASIFLGDSGSLMIGFLLGASGVLWSQRSPTLPGVTAPVMMLAIPLLDVFLSISRRFLRGRPIFTADRGHIHHRLLDLGFSPRRAALLLYGACALATAFSLAQSMAQDRIGVWVIALFCAAAWFGIQSLGYVEFGLAGRLIRSGVFQQSLDTHLHLRRVENSLRAAESVAECWPALCEACRIFGFAEARFRVANRVLYQRCTSLSADDGWNIRIPLPGGDYINFTRPQDSAVLPMGVAPLLDIVSKVMTEKCLESTELVPTLSTRTSIYEMENRRRTATE